MEAGTAALREDRIADARQLTSHADLAAHLVRHGWVLQSVLRPSAAHTHTLPHKCRALCRSTRTAPYI